MKKSILDSTSYYRQIRSLITEEKFEKLSHYQLRKPVEFNWVRDIFEPMNVASFPDSPALIWHHDEKERHFSFREMSNLSNQFLNFIRRYGISKGDLFYTQLSLVPANWISYLSAIKGGLVLIPAATTLAVRDISFRFKTLFPKLVIADGDNAEKIDAAEKEFEENITLKIIVDGVREGWHSIDRILEENPDSKAAQTQADDPLFYFFTSGTTGLPKVVVHTQFTYPVGHLTTASWVGMRHGDIHYNISQPGWAKFAWSSFFAPWAMGATIFVNKVKKFDVVAQLKTMEKVGVTTFCAPPTVLRMMIQEDLTQYQLKFRQCVAAGEPLNPDVIDKWEKGTGTIIRDGYGQTETTCLAANIPKAEIKYGSMGKPTFLYDIIIADDDGREQPALEEGHICVKLSDAMPNGVFIDYKGDTERRKKVFKHGLYYTGDKAYKDKDGFIWFVGRNDDVIKASDYRIGPFEVESVLIEHEAVVEAAVVASPHEFRGYAVKAFVVLAAGETPSEILAKNLFSFAEENLATYKIPRIIEFVEAFPKTISGKIRRIELRANEATDKLNKVPKEKEYFHEKY